MAAYAAPDRLEKLTQRLADVAIRSVQTDREIEEIDKMIKMLQGKVEENEILLAKILKDPRDRNENAPAISATTRSESHGRRRHREFFAVAMQESVDEVVVVGVLELKKVTMKMKGKAMIGVMIFFAR